MKLSIRGLALAMGILWGAAVFLVAFGHHACNGYGHAFLVAVGSIYPGYKVDGGMGAAFVGGAYAFVDGLVGGAILAWLYNLLGGSRKTAS